MNDLRNDRHNKRINLQGSFDSFMNNYKNSSAHHMMSIFEFVSLIDPDFTNHEKDVNKYSDVNQRVKLEIANMITL